MSKYTDNYNLRKPEKNENYDIEVANSNNTIIDAALYGKVDKKTGKDLSTNDFTDGYKKKIDAMQTLYRFKGTVETITALDSIANKNIGDVYKCKANSNDYIWNGLEWIDIGKHTDFNDVMSAIEEVQDDLTQMQTDIINDMSKKYTGRNITAPTVEGFGETNVVYGDITETGTGEKSPTNPYEIKCVGNDINLAQQIGGYLQNGVFKSSDDNSFVFRVKQGETYIVSGQGNRSHSAIFSEFPTNNATCIEGSYSQTIVRNTPFVASNTGYMVFYANTPSNQAVIDSFKAQKGSVATAYSNYGEGTVEIITKNGSNTSSNIIHKGKPLCAVKNAEGDFIARDKLEGNKVYRECELKILDGTENWIKSVGTSTDDSTAFWISLNNAGLYNCDKFEIIEVDNISTKQECIVANDTAISIKILNSRLSSADATGFKNWLSKNPVTIVYKLVTPIVEDINTSNKIVQYAENTTVYNRDNAELEVTLTNNNAVSDVYGDLKNVEENVSSLQTIENWKTLTDGIKYRKKGNDVEVWMNYLAAVTVPALNHSQVIAQLPNGYRPDIEIAIPIFVRSRTGPIYPELYLTILADGGIYFNNGSSNQIVADVFKAFVKY